MAVDCVAASLTPAEEAKQAEAEAHLQNLESRLYTVEQQLRIARLSPQVVFRCSQAAPRWYAAMFECQDFLPDVNGSRVNGSRRALDTSHPAPQRRQLVPSEPGAQVQCFDTPGWHINGFDCSFYANGYAPWGFNGYCADGAAKAGYEWTLGAQFNWPEDNCCACGKPGLPQGSLHLHADLKLVVYRALEILDLWCTTDIPQDPQHNTIKCQHNLNGDWTRWTTFLVPSA